MVARRRAFVARLVFYASAIILLSLISLLSTRLYCRLSAEHARLYAYSSQAIDDEQWKRRTRRIHLPPDRRGELLFYDRSNGTARAVCDALDNYRGNNKDDDGSLPAGACPFTDCMDALISSQRAYDEHPSSSRLPQQKRQALSSGYLEPMCSSDSSSAASSFHAAWLASGSDGILLKPTARLGLWSTIRAHPRNCVRVTVWVRTDDARAKLERQLEESWPDLSQAVSFEVFDAPDLADDIVAQFPSLRTLVNSTRITLEGIRSRMQRPTFSATSESDLLRVFVLAARGGIYQDLDVLLLRPLTPLLSKDFFYRWGTQAHGNTAVMHLQRGSQNAEKLVQEALTRLSLPTEKEEEESIKFVKMKKGPQDSKRPFGLKALKVAKGPQDSKGLRVSSSSSLMPTDDPLERLLRSFHPKSLSQYVQSMGLTIEMLPSAYFDPAWSLSERWSQMDKACVESCFERYGVDATRPGLSKFFSENNTVLAGNMMRGDRAGDVPNGKDPRELFFPGTFAFHWHNQWNDAMVENSTGGIFLRYFESR